MLSLTLKEPQIGENSELITVSHTFISVVDRIARCRAKPILIGIESDTYCMNCAEIENKVIKE